MGPSCFLIGYTWCTDSICSPEFYVMPGSSGYVLNLGLIYFLASILPLNRPINSCTYRRGASQLRNLVIANSPVCYQVLTECAVLCSNTPPFPPLNMTPINGLPVFLLTTLTTWSERPCGCISVSSEKGSIEHMSIFYLQVQSRLKLLIPGR